MILRNSIRRCPLYLRRQPIAIKKHPGYQWVATKTNDDENKERLKSNQHPLIVDKLNYAIQHHPLECVGSMIGLDILMIFGCYQGIKFTGYTFSAEFALAFALSRPLRRARFPIEVAVAGGLSNVIPSLSAIELTKLSNALPQSAKKSLSQAASKNTRMGRGLIYAKDSIDKYGASYMIGSRIVGVTTVFLIYNALLLGVDAQLYLESWGYENVGNVLGQWAGAVVLSTTMYPLSIASTAYIAPWIASLRSIGSTKR
jgi:hypothetical protein